MTRPDSWLNAVIMNPNELVRMFILNEISDDYENLAGISQIVGKLCLQCEFVPDPSEILHALFDLIDAGLAKAYRVSATHSFEEMLGFPPRDEVKGWRYGFLITRKGRDIQSSNEEKWPFDEAGLPRAGWCAPKRSVTRS